MIKQTKTLKTIKSIGNKKTLLKTKTKSKNENLFIAILKTFGLPAPIAEYKFHPTRKWRIDFAYPEKKIAIEIEGGVYIAGRHNRPSGFLKDMEKYNNLALEGWRLLRTTPDKLIRGEFIKQVIGIYGND